MATTYYSDRYFLNAANVQTSVGARFLPTAAGVTELGTYTMTGSFSLNDIIKMCDIAQNPSGNAPKVLYGALDTPALDTGGTPALTMGVGTIGSSTVFLSATTTPRAGGVAPFNVAGSTGFSALASPTDTVQIKVSAGAQTGATTGSIRLLVEYSYDP